MSAEMKDSGINGIGMIPNSWHIKSLGAFFSENTKVNYAFSSSNALQFKYGEIVQKANNNRDLEEQEIELLKKYILVEPNDIVVNGLNLNYDFNSLRIARVRESGIITSAYIVLRPKFDGETSYFNYLLKTLDYQKIFHGMGVGIRLTLKFKELRSMLIPVPTTVEEQSLIANFLDKKCAEIDELITLQEQMIAQLTTYKQAAITETVTKGLDPNVKMKDSGVEWIGEIPEHWTLKRLKNESTLNPSINALVLDDDAIVSYMPMECLRNGIIKQNSGKYSDVKHYIPFQEEDIVLAKVTPCFENGNIAIARNLDNNVGFGTSEIFVIRCKESMHNDFLFYYLQSTYVKNMGVASMTGTGGLKRVNPNVLNSLFLVYPPLSEQQSIANYLDQKCKEIDELISVKKEKIEKLKAYKKSVIYEYVTGKKQVSLFK